VRIETGFFRSLLNNVLLWLTGIVILLYTVETYGLRVEMVRQNELAVQPLVTVGIERRQSDDSKESKNVLVFRNIGRGPALFVQPADIQFREDFTVEFDMINLIEAGKETSAGVKLHMRREHSVRTLNAIEHLDPRYANDTYNVAISYEDVNGRAYGSLTRMGKDGIRLLGHGTRRVE
jgi:hypothetical protein